MVVVLGIILNLHDWLSNQCRARCCLFAASASDSSRPRTTLREAACLLTLCASGVRIIWLVDPQGTRGVLSADVAGFFLRLPQLMWMASFSVLVLSWSYVLSSVGDAAVPYKRLRALLMLCLVSLLR